MQSDTGKANIIKGNRTGKARNIQETKKKQVLTRQLVRKLRKSLLPVLVNLQMIQKT